MHQLCYRYAWRPGLMGWNWDVWERWRRHSRSRLLGLNIAFADSSWSYHMTPSRRKQPTTGLAASVKSNIYTKAYKLNNHCAVYVWQWYNCSHAMNWYVFSGVLVWARIKTDTEPEHLCGQRSFWFEKAFSTFQTKTYLQSYGCDLSLSPCFLSPFLLPAIKWRQKRPKQQSKSKTREPLQSLFTRLQHYDQSQICSIWYYKNQQISIYQQWRNRRLTPPYSDTHCERQWRTVCGRQPS